VLSLTRPAGGDLVDDVGDRPAGERRSGALASAKRGLRLTGHAAMPQDQDEDHQIKIRTVRRDMWPLSG
jgi:hypothetical protein